MFNSILDVAGLRPLQVLEWCIGRMPITSDKQSTGGTVPAGSTVGLWARATFSLVLLHAASAFGAEPVSSVVAGDARPAVTTPVDVEKAWYGLILELVRHTPTYSPPVASRAFAYLGVTAYEATASGTAGLRTLAGQLTAMPAMPKREAGADYDEAVVLEAAMADATHHYFSNTGPTGQRATKALETKLGSETSAAKPSEIVARSERFGHAIADAVYDWSLSDGGAVIENMGFPYTYELKPGPQHWKPTSTIGQQQLPLLPGWGKVRPFAMPSGVACPLPPPPDYSEEPASVFYTQAKEVYDTVKSLSPEQKAIARFWSDDPMLSPTPPGHWIAIALQVLDHEKADIARHVEVLARLGAATADAFIGCWNTKFEVDLVRPITYIRRVIDPKFDPLLITPPFPEYPSGHSTLSGASSQVLANAFGDAYDFTDATHELDNLPPRHFASFQAAAEEAAISRLYGGIHFRAAAERGLDQGRCIAAYAIALKTRE